jgi:hypothetical protein
MRLHNTLHFAQSAIALTLLCGTADSQRPQLPAPLDLSQYHMTFDDEFNKLDVSAHGPGTTWTAHTPWHGDFGDALFDDPGPEGPFSIVPGGGLTITAHKDDKGKWHSGLICSVNIDGSGQTGFRQKYGYFEISVELPPGSGTWPAFWLIGTDKSEASSEIDVLEYYGKFPNYFRSTEHLWTLKGTDVLNIYHVSDVTSGSLNSHFNRFGVSIDPYEMNYYLNGRVFWSTPTPPAYNQPFYIRVYQFNHIPAKN